MMDVDDAVVCTYELAGDFDLPEAARVVAMEQSTGTWTKVDKRPGSREDELAAAVLDADEGRDIARVAYPLDIFEPDNIPGFLAIAAGNFFGLGSLSKARWLDVEFPQAFVDAHPGPRFGIEGVREAAGTAGSGRPHAGTIVKPKVGLDPKGTAAACKEAALGGLDLIKDDETLTDQDFCPLEERTRLVLEALDQAREETGKTTLYAVNLTASPHEVADRWDAVKALGANCVMMDVLTAGYDGIRVLREAGCDVPIHVHRAMHGALTRSPDYGISMKVVCKMTRLVGGDQLHVGTASGKMEHPSDLRGLIDALREPWHGLKPVFPVASGGLHPASVEKEAEVFGTDFVVQAGGGIHGHPDGTTAGARAMRQAVDAVAADQRLEDAAKEHAELAAALEKWGGETYDYTH